jgi:hypothetical protein
MVQKGASGAASAGQGLGGGRAGPLFAEQVERAGGTPRAAPGDWVSIAETRSWARLPGDHVPALVE